MHSENKHFKRGFIMKLYSDVLKTITASILLASSLAMPSYADSTYAPISLGTQPGFDIGGQLSGYHYGEDVQHSFFAEEYGPQFGITGSGTLALRYGFFTSADVRLAYGNNQYNGSGSKGDNPDYTGEVRILGGKDFVTNALGVSAYAGLGYRNLYNDLRGSTDIGAQGYRRDSQYLYVPICITPRFRVTDTSRISTNIEYDYLVKGWQTTDLGDAIPGASDVTNTQNSGYGLRGSIMYEFNTWSFGPYTEYWNINESDIKVGGPGCTFGCAEPHNQTIEVGLQAKYHF